MATTTKPTFIAPLGGTVDPKFALSKKYPTVGYLTQPVNLTVTVIPPMDIEDQFKEFWATYGQFIGIFAGAFVGAFARQMFDIVKRKRMKINQNEYLETYKIIFDLIIYRFNICEE